MKRLLWMYPEEFFNEELTRFRREMQLNEGRADLVFEDANKSLLVLEVKLGKGHMGSLGQVMVYGIQVKCQCAPCPVRLGLLANSVSVETKRACLERNVECYEVSEERLREVAERKKFTFYSEGYAAKRTERRLHGGVGRSSTGRNERKVARAVRREEPGRTLSARCPCVPGAAWYGESQLYREALAESTEASDNFHIAGFLTVAGAALGKSVYVEAAERIHPNFYCVLVGESGRTCKTTAIRRAQKFVGVFSPGVKWFEYSVMSSREGFIKWVHDELRGAKGGATPAIIIRPFGDIESLIEGRHQGGRKIIDLLRDLHRSVSRLEVNTLRSPIKVQDPPCASLLGETARLSWLRNLKRHNISGGIADCIMFVCGDPKRRIPEPTEPALEPWNLLVSSLQNSCHFWLKRGSSEICLGEEARKTWVDFSSRVRDEAEADSFCAFVTRRLGEHVLKIAMVWAALEKSDTIRLGHMEAAVSFGDFLFQSVLHIFSLAPNLAEG